MEVHKLRHLWTRVKPVKPRYLFMVAGVFLIISGFALRANNMRMVELRDAVYAADKDNGDIAGTLTKLQRYVTAHMNTRLTGPNGVYPPIQLKYTYERLRAEQAKATNGQVYIEAQAECERQNPTDFSGRTRVPCIQAYVDTHGVQQKVIPQSLYKFDFVSPMWSPDFAGFMVLATVFFSFAGLVVWLVDRWFKRQI